MGDNGMAHTDVCTWRRRRSRSYMILEGQLVAPEAYLMSWGELGAGIIDQMLAGAWPAAVNVPRVAPLWPATAICDASSNPTVVTFASGARPAAANARYFSHLMSYQAVLRPKSGRRESNSQTCEVPGSN